MALVGVCVFVSEVPNVTVSFKGAKGQYSLLFPLKRYSRSGLGVFVAVYDSVTVFGQGRAGSFVPEDTALRSSHTMDRKSPPP